MAGIRAEWLGLIDSVGTVEPGTGAALVLLDANPLVHIVNANRISTVLLGGTLLCRPELEALRAAAKTVPDTRVDDWHR